MSKTSTAGQAASAKPVTYYVMHCIDFDSECLVANRPTFEGAVSALLSEHERAPQADLSVWRSDGIMLVPDVRAAKALAGQLGGAS